ncbi:MAG: hypothetical protein U1E20_06365 [Methylocystis sp.]|uniref:hypothetical protein n=1 Tax=Methylocystis sp. TaxID=1911079 RepID=UPI00393CD9A6
MKMGNTPARSRDDTCPSSRHSTTSIFKHAANAADFFNRARTLGCGGSHSPDAFDRISLISNDSLNVAPPPEV